MTEIGSEVRGSSVADIPSSKDCGSCGNHREAGQEICVVVSAMGRTTDDLIRLATQITTPATARIGHAALHGRAHHHGLVGQLSRSVVGSHLIYWVTVWALSR